MQNIKLLMCDYVFALVCWQRADLAYRQSVTWGCSYKCGGRLSLLSAMPTVISFKKYMYTLYILLLTCNCHLPQTSAVLQYIEQNSSSSEYVHTLAADLQTTQNT